jgi:hypothetical protein
MLYVTFASLAFRRFRIGLHLNEDEKNERKVSAHICSGISLELSLFYSELSVVLLAGEMVSDLMNVSCLPFWEKPATIEKKFVYPRILSLKG